MQTSLMGFLCMAGVAAIGAVLGFKMSKNNAEVSAVRGAFVALCGCIILFYVVVVGFSQRGLSLCFAVATFILPILVFYMLARRDYGVDNHHSPSRHHRDIRKAAPISDEQVRRHTLSFKVEEDSLNQEESQGEISVCKSDEILEVVQLDVESNSEDESSDEKGYDTLTSESEELLEDITDEQQVDSCIVEPHSTELVYETADETKEIEADSKPDYSDVVEQDDFGLEEISDQSDKPLKVRTSEKPVLYEFVSFEDDEVDLEEPVLAQRISDSVDENLDIDDIEEPVFVQANHQLKSESIIEVDAELEEVEVVSNAFAGNEHENTFVETCNLPKDSSQNDEPEEITVSKSPTSFNSQSYFDRATALRDNGQYAVAALLYRECLEKAVDYKTVNKAALEEIACYVKAGKVQKAAELAEVFLKTARKLTPAEKIKAEAVLRAGMRHE